MPTTHKKNPSARKKLFAESVKMDRSILIGYARISTQDRNLKLQIEALTKAGCRRISPTSSAGAGQNVQALKRLKKLYAKETPSSCGSWTVLAAASRTW